MQRLVLGIGFFAAAMAALGCTPAIGDACVQSTDCSQLGDRLCDPTQFEGYCTEFNCGPDTCPDSLCVAFGNQLDPACKTADDGRDPRFERQFCMKYCDSTSDCRDGYVCRSPAALHAHIIDEMPLGTKFCTNDTTLPGETIPKTIPGVCEAGDAGTPWTAFDGGTP